MNTATDGTSRVIPESWEPILADGERILWQGQPAQGIYLENSELAEMFFGFLLIVVPLVLFQIKANGPGSPPTFILLLILWGFWKMISPPLLGAFMRRFSFYTLTNRRAFIGQALPFFGRRLKSWPIGPKTKLEHISHSDETGTIFFARRSPPWFSRRRSDVPVGFEHITNAQQVLTLMSDLQRTPA